LGPLSALLAVDHTSGLISIDRALETLKYAFQNSMTFCNAETVSGARAGVAPDTEYVHVHARER